MNEEIKTKKCSVCDKIKTYCEFGVDKREKNGLKSRCKECRQKLEKKRKIIKYTPPKGYKKCTLCKEDKLICNFKKDRLKKSGLHSQCNKCVLLSRRKKPYLMIWRACLKNTLKRLGQNKEGHTIEVLGYSALELKQHIEALFTDGMTWDNWGEWHIDHIKPVSKFNPETPINEVNALSNLQPLWATTREINGIIYKGNLNKNKKYE